MCEKPFSKTIFFFLNFSIRGVGGYRKNPEILKFNIKFEKSRQDTQIATGKEEGKRGRRELAPTILSLQF